MIALVPARAGSKRLPGKNLRPLGGKPLISWTIEAARESEAFDHIYVCTDDFDCILIALGHPLDETWNVSPWQRDPVPDDQRDIEWLTDFLQAHPADEVMLLRPTSPFRDAQTIRRALEQWEACRDRLDSLRAVMRASETGWKQWVVEDWIELETPEGVCHDAWPTMRPLTTAAAKKHLHSFPTQSLEDCYIQTAGLEIFWAKTILEKKSLAGDQVGMFLMSGPEALDINTEDDFAMAELHLCHSQGLK